MPQDRANTLLLSSKKPFQGPTDCGPELKQLRAGLDAKRNQGQRAKYNVCVELRQLREEAKWELQRTLTELTDRSEGSAATARHPDQRQCLLSKRVCVGGGGRYCNTTGREAICSGSRETCQKLEHLLLRLYDEIHVEQAVAGLQSREQFELERAFCLHRLLNAREPLAQGWQRAERPKRGFKSLIHKPKEALSGDLFGTGTPPASSRAGSPSPQIIFPPQNSQEWRKLPPDALAADPCSTALVGDNRGSSSVEVCVRQTSPDAGRDNQPPCRLEDSVSQRSPSSKCSNANMEENGTDYVFLVHQHTELLRALDELEKTCSTLREENGLLRKSSAPETEEKVRRLRRKNTELTVLAKRLEERARKLQEANLKVANAPSPLRPGSLEHYKRAFARQRARDLAQHADALLCKDKEIAGLQQECRELRARLGPAKGSPVPSGWQEFERLLRESQREVLRLQRQLSISASSGQRHPSPGLAGRETTEDVAKGDGDSKVGGGTPCLTLDEAPLRCEDAPGEDEEEESGQRVTVLTPCFKEAHKTEQRLQILESELCKKRKECEIFEHEGTKRQKRCLDLENQLEGERGKNEQLKEEVDLLRRQLLDRAQAENEELREDLSDVTARHSSVLEENRSLRAKLENLEQVLKHMREVAERRQQLELEHEQALAILKLKQDEIKRLQRAQLFAKREHEGVVQMLEELTQLVLLRELSKVRDLEEKCRSQSEQFGLLSQELEKFRLQASKVDLAGTTSLFSNPNLSVLTNGVGLATERDVAAALRMGATPHAAELARAERSPLTRHRELPAISVSKSGSTSSKSEHMHHSPHKSDTRLNPHKSSPTHEVDTASEVEELDIDVTPAPYAKLQVFIARYSYNPYDGPNDNPEVELPLTAGEYIYVYGDTDDDGFYEGELMDGRRGLVPSNFVERVSDDDFIACSHQAEPGDGSHSSQLDHSLHSATSHQPHSHYTGLGGTEQSAPPGPPSPIPEPPPLTNGLDLDPEEPGVDTMPYPRKLTLVKQLAKSVVVSWDPPLVPAGWGDVRSYNVYVDQELRLAVPFGGQTKAKAVLERLDVVLKAYRVSVQSLTERGPSEPLRCSMLVGRDVSAAPTRLRVERLGATSADLLWLPSNSNYAHVVSLNDEERALVKAGRYSLCLNDLTPGVRYAVKVEARPHRTPWELPAERREHRSAVITFTTLMADPPDAPLDVQLEHGPSPGIALISWLPVTIDAAGTSNGVRVTGYTIYADQKKVLEVSSPTAGSALLGPSQIQSLQGALELTVRTTSAHGESSDSLPVDVPAKLAAIMAGPAPTAAAIPAEPAVSCGPPDRATPPLSPSYVNASAKVSMLPHATPRGLAAEAPANAPHAALLPSVSHVEAWANPSSAASGLAVHGGTLPAASTYTPAVVHMHSPPASVPSPPPRLAAPALVEQRRDTDSPGTIRPFPSIAEFLEDPGAKLILPEHVPTAPLKIPAADPPNPLSAHGGFLPRNPSPLESEAAEEEEEEEEGENTRLVSVEEFLRPEQEPACCRNQQGYGSMLGEPAGDYHTENSRSDLSDILEEEEEDDLYSDPLGGPQHRGNTACRSCRLHPPDRSTLQLPPVVGACHDTQLFSIPEVTEEDDSTLEEAPPPRCRRPHTQILQGHPHFQVYHPQDPHTQLHPNHRDAPRQDQEPPNRHHINLHLPHPLQTPRAPATEPQVRPKSRHGVRYPEQEVEMEEEAEEEDRGACSRTGVPRGGPSRSWERPLTRGLGDRRRKEAALRSNTPAPPPPAEISLEYGSDDSEEPPERGPLGEVDQMNARWWGEGAPGEHSRPPQHHRGPRGPLALQQRQEAGTAWGGQPELSPTPACSQARQLPGGADSPMVPGDSVRIFVALFPYEPATMSPNPDAAEEELPFREGQIIKVTGDKDADGFYRGECGGHVGYVPCNMVSEIQVEDDETRQQLLQQGFLSTEASLEKMGTRTYAQLPRRPVPPLKPRRSKKVESAALWEESVDSSSQEPSQTAPVAAGNPPRPGARRMVAVFDYDPHQSSPNTDIEAELPFNAGDIIHVYGDMDNDGFFYGDLNGRRGLVPSNFLQALPIETPAGPATATATAEPRREPQADRTAPLEQPNPGPSTLEERPLPRPQPEPLSPDQVNHTPLERKLTPTTEPARDPAKEPAQDPEPAQAKEPAQDQAASSPVAADSPTHTDCSTPGKKKKGFFSKGRKLFRKLGSSKK